MQNKLISNVIRIGYTGLHVYAIKKLQNKPIMWPNQLIKESSRLSSLRPSCTLMLFSNIAGYILQPICLKFSTQLLISVEFFSYQIQNNSIKVWSRIILIDLEPHYCIWVDLIFINIFFSFSLHDGFFTKLLENEAYLTSNLTCGSH